MKKILFACLAGIALTNSISIKAQTYWVGSTTVQTSTSGNCTIGGNAGIGGNASITGNASVSGSAAISGNAIIYNKLSVGSGTVDAKLRIENTAYVDVAGPYNVGEIKIHRTVWPGPTPPPIYTAPNIIDITRTQNLHLPYTTSSLFVLADGGSVGINLSNPAHLLDVNGDIHAATDALIDGNTTVGGDIYITHSNDALWRNIFANANSTGLALYSKSTTLDGPAILMTGTSSSDHAGDMRFFDGASSSSRFAFGKPVSGSPNGSMMEQVVIEGNGDISMPRDNDVDWRSINAKAGHGALSINGSTSSTNGAAIEVYGGANTDRPGRIQFISNDAGEDPNGLGFNFINYDPTHTWVSRARIYKNGKMAIGDDGLNTPDGYRLYVQDGILTQKLKVALPSDGVNWSDYVFAKDYNLRSLVEVERFINKNKHLPDVPSAKEVSDDGIDVAAMDAKLLRKIEELTLYVIDQQKQIEDLKKKLNK